VRIPLIIHLAAAADAAPLLAAVAARRPVRGARGWLLVWCATIAVFNYTSLYLALHGTHNVWLSYIFTPLSTALVLWALSCWQTGEVARLTMRYAIVPVLVLWAVLTAAFENTSTFSHAAEPMAYLVCLAVAAYTLLVRSLQSRGDLLRQDWLWVTAGLALYFGTWSSIVPLSALLAGSAPALLARAYETQAVLEIAAMLAIARGVTCPAAT
jgi:hypothetical protein